VGISLILRYMSLRVTSEGFAMKKCKRLSYWSSSAGCSNDGRYPTLELVVGKPSKREEYIRYAEHGLMIGGRLTWQPRLCFN